MRFIRTPDQSVSFAELGGKAAALARLRTTSLVVPDWFVLVPEAYDECVRQLDIAERGVRSPDAFTEDHPDVAPTGLVAEELREAVRRLSPHGELLAVRSSADSEDGTRNSMAGQLDSFLAVDPVEAANKVALVWRSAFCGRIRAYRREKRMSGLWRAPAVLIQRMLNPVAAGVAFGADPVTGRRGITVISAVHGLSCGLVSGGCNGDSYHVDRCERVIRQIIARKTSVLQPDPRAASGYREVPVAPTDQERPVLSADQIMVIARAVATAGELFGRPQDVEWAIEDGRVFVLQARPITTLGGMSDPDAEYNLWDNSNIAESYGGVTTPLTFSFIRHVYEGVYRQFCRILRVSTATIDANDEVFRRMLGLIRGRVYYNLTSWYRVLAMLPGFRFNQAFMQQMMGTRVESIEPPFTSRSPTAWRRVREYLLMTRGVFSILSNYFLLRGRLRSFDRRLKLALEDPGFPLHSMRADELVTYFESLQQQLLTQWDAPILNDFFVMIFHGILRRLTKRWCPDNDGLADRLLAGQGDIISTQPATRLRKMAAYAAQTGLSQRLCEAPLSTILETIGPHPEFKARFDEYLHQFGDRCFDELKLETRTLHEDSLPLLRMIGRQARTHITSGDSREADALNRRSDAESRVWKALSHHPVRRGFLRWILSNVRQMIKTRENLRFERTKVFARVRRVFIELGRRLHADDLLDSPRDVFYLEFHEVLGFVRGTATSADLRGLAAVRAAEFTEYREQPSPDRRFETRGMVHQGNTFRGPQTPPTNGALRSGVGCSSGVVRAPIRIVMDPLNDELKDGEILVAERTDPGWILLFPSAKGLLLEYGSPLSHAAIVARELGIPAVVGVSGATSWLSDGEVVELDGSAGTVRRT